MSDEGLVYVITKLTKENRELRARLEKADDLARLILEYEEWVRFGKGATGVELRMYEAAKAWRATSSTNSGPQEGGLVRESVATGKDEVDPSKF